MKNNFIYKSAAILLGTSVLLWAALWLVVGQMMPQYYFPAYWTVPLLFLVFSLILSALIWAWCKKLDSGTVTYDKVVSRYAIWKGAKVAVCLAAIFIYRSFEKEYSYPFLISLFAFYILFLIAETIVMSGMGKSYASTPPAKNGDADINEQQ